MDILFPKLAAIISVYAIARLWNDMWFSQQEATRTVRVFIVAAFFIAAPLIAGLCAWVYIEARSQ